MAEREYDIHLPMTEVELIMRGRLFDGSEVEFHASKIKICAYEDLIVKHIEREESALEKKFNINKVPPKEEVSLSVSLRGVLLAGDNGQIYSVRTTGK